MDDRQGNREYLFFVIYRSAQNGTDVRERAQRTHTQKRGKMQFEEDADEKKNTIKHDNERKSNGNSNSGTQ